MEYSKETLPRERNTSVLRRLQKCVSFRQAREDVQRNITEAERICDMAYGSECALHGCDITDGGDSIKCPKEMAAVEQIVRSQNGRIECCGKSYGSQSSSERRTILPLRDGFLDTSNIPEYSEDSKCAEKRLDTRAGSWLRRTVSTTFRRHRRPSSSSGFQERINKHHLSPVSFRSLEADLNIPNHPRNPPGGAAARAAAAAQNEILESARFLTMHDNSRLTQPKVSNDSESGIGIDLRESSDNLNLTLPVMRTGT